MPVHQNEFLLFKIQFFYFRVKTVIFVVPQNFLFRVFPSNFAAPIVRFIASSYFFSYEALISLFITMFPILKSAPWSSLVKPFWDSLYIYYAVTKITKLILENVKRRNTHSVFG